MSSSFFPRILQVDDNDDSCDLNSFMLKRADPQYQITVARNANEALQLIEEQSANGNRPFDLYLLDYLLYDLTGVTLCKIIRETDKYTPVVFFTSMARRIDRAEAMNAGATEYLVKPDDLQRLTETVARLLVEIPANDERRSLTTTADVKS